MKDHRCLASTALITLFEQNKGTALAAEAIMMDTTKSCLLSLQPLTGE